MILAQATATPDLASPAFWATPYPWIVVAVVVAIAAIVRAIRRRRSRELQNRFGPEYDRTLRDAGSRERAEAELQRREVRHRQLEIRPLTPGARERYTEEWHVIQERFVDSPTAAIEEADRLVSNVMRDRGYPADSFDQTVSDLSVEHGADLDHYRAAHAIALRADADKTNTEELRQAFVHYRALFESLLGTEPTKA
jgi:hypothetical protein